MNADDKRHERRSVHVVKLTPQSAIGGCMRLDGSPQTDVVMLCEASTSKFAVQYFLSVFFGFNTRFVSSSTAARKLLNGESIPKLLVLSLERATDRWCSIVASIASLRPKPFILVLTSDPHPDVVVKVFEANVDEVIRLPVSLAELACRLRARAAEIGLCFEFQLEQLRTLDVTADIIQRAKLTDIEAKLIGVLLKNEGRTVSRECLSQEIDKTAWNYGNRKFDVHMSHIRKKLDNAFDGLIAVRTVRASGYALDILSRSKD